MIPRGKGGKKGKRKEGREEDKEGRKVGEREGREEIAQIPHLLPTPKQKEKDYR